MRQSPCGGTFIDVSTRSHSIHAARLNVCVVSNLPPGADMQRVFDAHIPSTSAWQERLVRACRICTILVVALCVGLQGLALSADRALGQPHYHHHVKSLVVRAHEMHEALRQRNESLNQHADANEGALHEHPHSHRQLSRHKHDPGDSSVVYADTGDHASSGSSPGSLPRSVHDLDGLIRIPELRTANGLEEQWPPDGAPLFRSNITAPPLPPPRA